MIPHLFIERKRPTFYYQSYKSKFLRCFQPSLEKKRKAKKRKESKMANEGFDGRGKAPGDTKDARDKSLAQPARRIGPGRQNGVRGRLSQRGLPYLVK